jgi:hypothetical protein
MTRQVHTPPILCILILQLWITGPALSAPPPPPVTGLFQAGETTLVYRMRGEVRLLIVWLGKDDVGGGRITLRRNEAAPGARWFEEIEVLFGSSPDQIPGKVNRWGYGREIAEWAQESPETSPHLLATRFEGLMRRSDEKSIAQARKADKTAAAKQLYSFAATESRVFPGEAASEIRYFSEAEEFHYQHPNRLLARYRQRLPELPVAEHEYLLNQPATYELPYGFLSGLSQLLAEVANRSSPSSQGDGESRRGLTFVYNACPYRLELRSVRSDAGFRLASENSAPPGPGVVRVGFRSTNTVKNTQTYFEMWLARSGGLKGVPLRIQIQPRWWLRLRLDLDAARSSIPDRPARDEPETAG